MNIPARAYSQYRNKPNFMAWLDIAHKMGGSLADAAKAVRDSYNIDTATGEQLDVLGRIVVIDRNFIGYIPLYPGLFDLTDGDECGDDENAIFAELDAATDSRMGDDLYRLAIKAKIAKNNGPATIRSILDQMRILLPNATLLRVKDNEDMTFAIEYGGDISELQRWALLNIDLIQRPQGVLLNEITEVVSSVQFGDSAKQFGDPLSMFSGYLRI